jgi:alpha-tubulin suppressor-like RCC1 family protein
VLGVSTATQVSLSASHLCILLSNETVQCVGQNSYGKLGNSSTTDSLSLVNVDNLSGAAQISVGSNFSCARLTDGTVKCWGYNGNGQLGDATTTSKTSATSVVGVTGASEIVTGGSHGCAIVADQRVKCWGNNQLGQLGDGTVLQRSTPVYRLNELSALRLGSNSSSQGTLIIRTNGEVYSSGSNSNNQAGFNEHYLRNVSGL